MNTLSGRIRLPFHGLAGELPRYIRTRAYALMGLDPITRLQVTQRADARVKRMCDVYAGMHVIALQCSSANLYG
jgi:hypothetical protein